ncbi:hypothetical protein F4779DRAFT_612288 [Xylariaceae sp. FL0662B]|nr:hypothetical protein F4779DRAFT_612288 [Xylariaceae sp. FL0662B]
MRDLKPTSISDGTYFLDGGAEKLVLYWMDSMRRLIFQRDGIERKLDDPELVDLIYKAGSAAFSPKRPKGVSDREYINLCLRLAPIESDGVDDEDEWNLIDEFTPLEFDDIEDLKETDSLSTMLRLWHTDRTLVCIEENRLTEHGKESKSQIGEKASRAIRRLSAIPMPDFQSAFLSGLYGMGQRNGPTR